MTGTVVVVGLGPAGPELVPPAALAAFGSVGPEARFVRTSRHPAVDAVAGASSFDHRYAEGDDLPGVYGAIVSDLVEAAGRHGRVAYGVPGSPLVAERTVELLRHHGDVHVEVVPALSFLDLAWSRLGVDPMASGVRLVDGHRFAVEAAGERGPLLVGQCDSRLVLSEVKLSVEDPPSGAVTVLQRLGLPDEAVAEVAWEDLDRAVQPDHLTTLWIPHLAAPVGSELERLRSTVRTLRDECPWDREQTHRSLARYMLEEAGEAVEAIEALDDDDPDTVDELCEELGDVLLQVVLHARIAEQEGRFDLADVARAIDDKLVRRHPHVFGDADAATAADVELRWEDIKRAEREAKERDREQRRGRR